MSSDTTSSLASNQAIWYRVTVGSTQYTQDDPKGLVSMIVEDHVDMIGVAHISFSLANETWSGFEIGSDVEVEIGESTRKMFKGIITGVRHTMKVGNEVVTLVAMDPLCKMAASRRTLVHEEKADSKIVEDTISSAGCTKGTVEGTDVTHKYVLQRNESDLDFAKRLAARNNKLLIANEGNIDFVSPQFGGTAVEIIEEDIDALDWSLSTMNVPKKITVYGWDYVKKEKVEGSADSVEQTIGTGDSAVDATGVIWQADSYVSDVLVGDQDAAKAMAESEMERLARNFLRGRCVMKGNGDVYAGIKIKFVGLREGFNPTGYVISTRQIFEVSRGHHTEVHFCSNTVPE